MIPFSQSELSVLTQGPSFIERPEERVCPACEKKKIRTYLYGADRGPGRPTIISYTWCAACGRGVGSTGPRPSDLFFTDPLEHLTKDERRKLSTDRDEDFFAVLDGLWDEGKLPQRFWKR